MGQEHDDTQQLEESFGRFNINSQPTDTHLQVSLVQVVTNTGLQTTEALHRAVVEVTAKKIKKIILTNKRRVSWKREALRVFFDYEPEKGNNDNWNKLDNKKWNDSPHMKMRFCHYNNNNERIVRSLLDEDVVDLPEYVEKTEKFVHFCKWAQAFPCTIDHKGVIYMVFVRVFERHHYYAGKSAVSIMERFVEREYAHVRKAAWAEKGTLHVYSDFVIGLAKPEDVVICAFDAERVLSLLFDGSNKNKDYYAQYQDKQWQFLEQVFISYTRRDNSDNPLSLNQTDEILEQNWKGAWTPAKMLKICQETEDGKK